MTTEDNFEPLEKPVATAMQKDAQKKKKKLRVIIKLLFLISFPSAFFTYQRLTGKVGGVDDGGNYLEREQKEQLAFFWKKKKHINKHLK